MASFRKPFFTLTNTIPMTRYKLNLPNLLPILKPSPNSLQILLLT